MLTDFDSIGRTIMPCDISRTYRQISNHILPCLLALPMGAAVGAVDALFGRVLLAVGSFRDSHVIALLPFLPIAGILITWLYKKFGNKAERGMGLVFDVGHGRESSIPLRLVPLITTSTWATHLFGGSAGREGVAVQMGATISQWVATRLKRPRSDNTLLIAGMAAGFSGLFRTPIAATMFALEVLHAGRIEYRALMPALLGSLCASATSGALGLEKFQVSVAIPSTVDIGTLLKVIALGAIFGLVGSAFAWLLARAKASAAAHLENPYLRIAVMGAAIAVFGLLLFSGRYAGLGTNLIEPERRGRAPARLARKAPAHRRDAGSGISGRRGDPAVLHRGKPGMHPGDTFWHGPRVGSRLGLHSRLRRCHQHVPSARAHRCRGLWLPGSPAFIHRLRGRLCLQLR